jgi:uncharacterized protein YkwD
MSAASPARAFAIAAVWLLSGCAAPSAAAPAGPLPCNAALVDASNYADDLAEHREEQMKVMRFASEAAMNAYVNETRHLRMEGLRLNERLQAIAEKHGGTPDYTRRDFGELTAEEARTRIAAADACADEALK